MYFDHAYAARDERRQEEIRKVQAAAEAEMLALHEVLVGSVIENVVKGAGDTDAFYLYYRNPQGYGGVVTFEASEFLSVDNALDDGSTVAGKEGSGGQINPA